MIDLDLETMMQMLGVEVMNRVFAQVDAAEGERLMNLGRENPHTLMLECLSILGCTD